MAEHLRHLARNRANGLAESTGSHTGFIGWTLCDNLYRWRGGWQFAIALIRNGFDCTDYDIFVTHVVWYGGFEGVVEDLYQPKSRASSR